MLLAVTEEVGRIVISSSLEAARPAIPLAGIPLVGTWLTGAPFGVVGWLLEGVPI